MPAPRRGLIAGSALRDVLELAGVRDVAGKIFSGSKNKLNIARATVKALSEFGTKNTAPVVLTGVIVNPPNTLAEAESVK